MKVRSKPETYEPPYDAHTSIFPPDWTEYAACLIGVQAAPGADAGPLRSELEGALTREPAPLHFERVEETDAQGYVNSVYIAYWRGSQQADAWRGRPDVKSLFETPRSGPLGLWRETILAPIANVDPSGFRSRHEWGVGRYVTQEWERYHGYYGSMRDRMPAGHDPVIDREDAPLTHASAPDSFGRRLVVQGHDNLCYIRGVFGWRQARQEQQDVFLAEMMPVYETGVRFLRDNPIETGCISARIAREVTTDRDTGIDAET
ncbi:MAG: phenylacetaldoxime dehydratase family protein, partial [Caulobacterales bacterium]|nr:phenylacetaldoxime dehydratase family protein [Caulobacterales bacterium]